VKTLSIALALFGALVTTLLVVWFDAGRVAEAVLSVGWDGFAAFLAWQLVLFAVLGAAWRAVMPAEDVGWGLLIWGRMVRDAATNSLPFSPVGGFVLGARALTLHGVGWPAAGASTIVDVTAEVIAQIAFAAVGLTILAVKKPDSALVLPIGLGLGAAFVAMVAAIFVQHGIGPVFAWLGDRIAGRKLGGGGIDSLHGELRQIYRSGTRLGLCLFGHMVGWLGSGVAGWIAFRLLNVPIEFASALAVEGLLNAALAVTFVVPASAGVQEAAYAGLGSVFGVPPDLALAVSLLRRARDLAVGIPILLVWQGFEARRLRLARQPPS
jgi:putative membrane protein